MATVERHDNRPPVNEILETDQLAVLVRQHKRRHRLTRRRRVLAGAGGPQTVHHAIDDIGESRIARLHVLGKCLQPLGQRSIHAAAAQGGLLEKLSEGLIRHGRSLVQSRS